MEQIWPKVLDEVSRQISPMYYNSFISRLSLVKVNERKLVVKAPSTTIKDHIEKKYQKCIEDAFYSVSTH